MISSRPSQPIQVTYLYHNAGNRVEYLMAVSIDGMTELGDCNIVYVTSRRVRKHRYKGSCRIHARNVLDRVACMEGMGPPGDIPSRSNGHKAEALLHIYLSTVGETRRSVPDSLHTVLDRYAHRRGSVHTSHHNELACLCRSNGYCSDGHRAAETHRLTSCR